MPPTLYKHHQPQVTVDQWLVPAFPSFLLPFFLPPPPASFPSLPISLSFTVLNNQTPLQLTLFTSLSAQYEEASSPEDELLVVLKGEWSWVCVLWDWRAKTCYEIFHLEIYSDFFFLIRRLFRIYGLLHCWKEKAMVTHSSTLAWKIPWTEEPGRLQSMGSLRVGHDWATSLSLFTFMHWRRKWQPTPVFLPGESQGRRSLWGHTESDTTEVT